MLVRLQLAELGLFRRDFEFETGYFSFETRYLLFILGYVRHSLLLLILLIFLQLLHHVLQGPFLVLDLVVPGIKLLQLLPQHGYLGLEIADLAQVRVSIHSLRFFRNLN